MTASLNSLSVELIDLIVSHLSDPAVASLRLTHRAANNAVLQTRYLHRFRTRRLWLKTASLQTFEQLTRLGNPVYLPQHLTLLGALRFNKELDDQTEHQQILLACAFSNLRKRGVRGSLASLILDVSVPEEESFLVLENSQMTIDSWTYVWDVAHRTFTMAMGALSDSGLDVTQELDLFTAPISCSLCYKDFIDIPTTFPGVLKSLRGLKELKASLSRPTTVPPELRRFDLEEQYRNLEPRNILQDIIRALVAVAPAAESVLMHWSDLNARWRPRLDAPEEVLAVPKLQLQRCILQGFKVSEVQLLAFLKHTRPATLELEYVQMFQGHWDRVFRYITSGESGVRSYDFDDVKEDHKIVHFNAPGDIKFRYKDAFSWPSRITRDGDRAREPIEHRLALGKVADFRQWKRWREDKLNRFSISLDFVRANPRELADYREFFDDQPEDESDYELSFAVPRAPPP
ncbi:hypothetical protein PWT90_04592 [Aphanocladium album]|nr:hypothetical protein PWT90_04592 [Aphanocladium album]